MRTSKLASLELRVDAREGREPGAPALSSTASGALSSIRIAQQTRPMAAAGPWGRLRPSHVHTHTVTQNQYRWWRNGGACACGGAGTHTRTGFGCAGAHWAWPAGPATSASEKPTTAPGGVGARKGPLHRPMSCYSRMCNLILLMVPT